MYILPRVYKCPVCDFEMEYGPHEGYKWMVDERDNPICPECYKKFLKKNVPFMQPIKPDKYYANRNLWTTIKKEAKNENL